MILGFAVNKRELLNLAIDAVKKDLQLALEASSSARQAATDAQAKAEHKYDTRGLEQSYLADGQSRRASELIESLALLESMPLKSFDEHSVVEMSAVVELESEDGELQRFFIVPRKGGIKLKHENQDYTTLSLDSPMGESILSKSVGDSVQVKVKSKTIAYAIVAIL
jgi:transcription elongation GreA/GreB family factor